MNWKKYLFVGFGIGIGIVAAVVIVFLVVEWHSSHKEQTWNAAAIHTEYSTFTCRLDSNLEVKGMAQEYVVENNSGSDYTISTAYPLMITSKGSYEQVSEGRYEVSGDCFVPAGQKIKCSIRVPTDYDTSWDVEGFAIFDTAKRYKIEFAKPKFPSPEQRKDAIKNLKKELTS